MTVTWLLLAVGVGLIVAMMMSVGTPKQSAPEFNDTTQVRKTIAVEDSSYAQQTNHMNPAPYNLGPIVGIETPFRVNQYTSYVV